MIPLPVDPTVVVLVNESGGILQVKSNISPELTVVVARSVAAFETASSGRPYTPHEVREQFDN